MKHKANRKTTAQEWIRSVQTDPGCLDIGPGGEITLSEGWSNGRRIEVSRRVPAYNPQLRHLVNNGSDNFDIGLDNFFRECIATDFGRIVAFTDPMSPGMFEAQVSQLWSMFSKNEMPSTYAVWTVANRIVAFDIYAMHSAFIAKGRAHDGEYSITAFGMSYEEVDELLRAP